MSIAWSSVWRTPSLDAQDVSAYVERFDDSIAIARVTQTSGHVLGSVAIDATRIRARRARGVAFARDDAHARMLLRDACERGDFEIFIDRHEEDDVECVGKVTLGRGGSGAMDSIDARGERRARATRDDAFWFVIAALEAEVGRVKAGERETSAKNAEKAIDRANKRDGMGETNANANANAKTATATKRSTRGIVIAEKRDRMRLRALEDVSGDDGGGDRPRNGKAIGETNEGEETRRRRARSERYEADSG